jgi:hypothetical protein
MISVRRGRGPHRSNVAHTADLIARSLDTYIGRFHDDAGLSDADIDRWGRVYLDVAASYSAEIAGCSTAEPPGPVTQRTGSPHSAHAPSCAISLWIARGQTTPGPVSRGEFGAYAIDRILGLLRRTEVPATFFIPGHTLETYPAPWTLHPQVIGRPRA